MVLTALPLRFRFRALEPVYFPAGKASNIFRGAFGLILRRIACEPGCVSGRACSLQGECVYARIFEPRAMQGGPSGFHDQPRPFVIRAANLDGKRFQPGEEFEIEILNFDLSIPVFSYFRIVFVQLFREGLGPGRAKMELVDAVQAPEVHVELNAIADKAERLRISFLTPTELKAGGNLLRMPDFGALVARARDRVNAICRIYQGISPDLDFVGLGERARAVHMSVCKVKEFDVVRKSGRTGQRYEMGGFVGFAEYAGDLGEFLPIIRAAEYTGVGRMTVWGHGQIRVSGVR